MASFNDEASVKDEVLTDRENAEMQDSLRTGISRHGERIARSNDWAAAMVPTDSNTATAQADVRSR
jgi:hypothetical protein